MYLTLSVVFEPRISSSLSCLELREIGTVSYATEYIAFTVYVPMLAGLLSLRLGDQPMLDILLVKIMHAFENIKSLPAI